MILLLLACKTEKTDTQAPALTEPDIETLSCGGPTHTWLPFAGMGEVIEATYAADLSLNATTINALLSSQGYGDLTPVPYGVNSYRVRYWTQDRGQRIEATMLATFPDTDGTIPTLLWLHPTAGFNDSCAPSGLDLTNNVFPLLWASFGMAVASPDYLGMKASGDPSTLLHPYLITETFGVVSLDALRALSNVAELKQEPLPDPKHVVHWGVSEGAYAALWTDRYAEHYAPEYTTVGVVAAMPVTNLSALTKIGVSTPTDTTIGIAGAMATMAPWFSGPPLSDVMNPPFDTQLPEELANSCDDFPVMDTVTTPEDLYTPAFIQAAQSGDWTGLEPWECYLEQGNLTESTIPRQRTAPLLFITGENDTLTAPAPVHEDIPKLCEQGYTIQHRQCAGTDHVDTAVQTLSYQLNWAMDRQKGTALNETTCVVATPAACP